MKLKHFVHHLLFPRESNNHRPKVLHHDSLFFVIALFIFLGSLLGVINTNYPQVLGISTNISSQELLDLTNQKRQEHGLAPLVMNNQLAFAADQKATHMFANDYWAHIAPDGTTPWYFIKNAGYEYLYAGENLARGFTTASAVVEAWMNSPTHRDNMLSKNYNDVGFAIQTGLLTGTETILVVEELGSQYEEQKNEVATAAIVLSPTPSIAPTLPVTPTPTPQVVQKTPVVASVANKPLIDKQSITQTVAYGLLVLLVVVLVIDAIIIERKKIVRLVAHNVDHILFLIIILLVAIILGRGLIL